MPKADTSPPSASGHRVVDPASTAPLSDAAVGVRPIALVYRLIALTVVATGVIRHLGLPAGPPDWSTLLFYTMLSNLLCLVWMLILVMGTARDLVRRGVTGTSTPSPRWSGAVMMAITVTMLIYLVVLVPTRFEAGDTDIFSLTDNLIHIITPALVVLDWLLFVPKGAFRWIDALLWTLIPYAYLTWAFVYGAFGGEFTPGQRYPYPFMDLDVLGAAGVASWIAALTAALVVVGLTFVAVDRALADFVRRLSRARARAATREARRG